MEVLGDFAGYSTKKSYSDDRSSDKLETKFTPSYNSVARGEHYIRASFERWNKIQAHVLVHLEFKLHWAKVYSFRMTLTV